MSAWRRPFLTALLSVIPVLGCTAPNAQPPLFKSAPGSPNRVAGAPGSIALGDLNGDAALDIVAASGPGVVVLLGRGDGRFTAAAGSPIQVSGHPTEMVLGDLNGDAKLDLVLAEHDSYAATILMGNGRGGFTPSSRPPVVMREGRQPHTHGLNVGDLNGDGHLDLVTVNSDDNDVTIALGDGKGGFTRSPSPFPVGRSPYPGALADLNGDGALDIVATSTSRRSREDESATNSLTVHWGDGHGGFRAGTIPLRTILPWCVAVGDLNGDRRPDLAVSHAERNEQTVLLGDGKGGFTEAAGSPFDHGRYVWRMEIADANADGKADVLAAGGVGVCVMLGDGRGGFQRAPGSPFPTGKGAWQLAAGDVNRDGRPDVVTSDLETSSISVLLGAK